MSGCEHGAPQVAGTYHPAGSARAIEAALTGRDGAVEIALGDGTVARADAGSFNVSDRIAGVPRRIEFGDGAAFVSRDDDGVEAVLGPSVIGRTSSRIARLERPGIKLFVIGTICVLAVVAGLRWGVPFAARAAAAVVPHAVNAQIGAGTLATIDRLLASPSKLSAAEQARIAADFDRLAAAAGMDGRAELNFRDMEAVGPNAFAMAGGVIVVTDQLVRFAKDPGEVSGVIAHELAHAEFRHAEQAIWQAIGFGLALTVMFGDAGTLAEEAAAAGVLVLQRSYSREHESGADLRAIETIAAAGMEPGHLVVALDRLHAGCGAACAESSWLSSHPGGDEREATLCRALDDPGPAAALCAQWTGGD